MTTTELLLFILAFILPIAYQRIHFRLKRAHFEELSPVRKRSGLQIHHGHWGLVWIFISSMWLIFFGSTIYIILLAGFGWGLLMDEIIPSLKTPSHDRGAELVIYKNATRPTLLLALCVIIFFIILFIM